MHLEEFAPHMRPAGGLDDAVAGEQLVEPGVAIGIDGAAERLQVGLRMLVFAIRRVDEQRRQWALTRKGPLVADVSP